MKVWLFLLALLGVASACTPLNLSLLNGTVYTAAASSCYSVVYDGANVSLEFDVPNLTVINGTPQQANIVLNITPGNASQQFSYPSQNSTINVAACPADGSAGDGPLDLNIGGTGSYAGLGSFNSYNINVSCPTVAPATVCSLDVVPGTDAQIFSNSTCNVVVEGVPAVLTCPFVNLTITPSTSNQTFSGSDYWVEDTGIPTITQSMFLTQADQNQTTTDAYCNFTAEVDPGYCMEDQTITFTNASVWHSNLCDDTVACAPDCAEVAAQESACPVCNPTGGPTGFYNLSSGELATIGQATAYCQNTTQVLNTYVVLNSSTQNVSCANKLYVAICTDNITPDGLQYLARGDGTGWLNSETQGLQDQMNAMNNSIYGPGGWVNQTSTLQGEVTRFNNGGDIINAVINGLMLIVGAGILIYVLSRNRRSPNNLGFRRPMDSDESVGLKKGFDDEISKKFGDD